jgi:superfamily II DNA or RNA helicase
MPSLKSDYHCYYGVGRDSDIARKVIKLGETSDPYGTSSFPDDQSGYRFIIRIRKVDEPTLISIEQDWMDRFPKIEAQTQSINRVSSIEVRQFTTINKLIEGFKLTLNKFNLDANLESIYLEEQQIESILHEYKSALDKTTQPVKSYIDQLNSFQQPYLQTLQSFLDNNSTDAAMVEAVCGFGKTVLTTKSLNQHIDRVFIVVPTDSLKSYWRDDLIKFAGFSKESIYDIGGSGINDLEQISAILKQSKFALILCYASTPLLIDIITTSVQIGIFDEAHRLAGIAEINDADSNEEPKKQDIGRTKRLIRKCKDLGIKRLSLTFTPKGFDSSDATVVNSNDDVMLFGHPIIKVSLREMIAVKLLPDYKIRFPHGNTTNGDTLKSKVQLFVNAFQHKTDDSYIMNHAIIFASCHADCINIVKYLKEEVQQTEIIYLNTASTVANNLARFEQAPRAIIVNCMLLGEGVNVRCADSVCIMYPKKSYSQIIQMLLRAGRYYPTKSSFYIIMTLLDDDPSEDVQDALEALTRFDIHFDQQILRVLLDSKDPTIPKPDQHQIDENGINDRILTTSADWNDIDAIRKCFITLIRKRTTTGSPSQQIQHIRKLCKRNNIQNSSQYNRFRVNLGWMEEPWLKRNMTAYDFFHDENDHDSRMKPDTLRAKILENGINSTESYSAFFKDPSVEENTNLQLFLPNVAFRRR